VSAADALERIGTADLGAEANDYRRHIRGWITSHAPDGLAARTQWNLPGYRFEDRMQAMTSPEYLEWERTLLAEHLVCPNWPNSYGGGGLSPVQTLVFAEECVRAGIPRVERGMGERLVGPAILAHGTPEQKAYFLPRIITGEDVYCQGYSEPDHGSDLAAVETIGVVEGEEIVIYGQKLWTSGAHRANMIFILCRTDPQAPRHRGLSYVLARFAPDNGISWRPVRQLTGDASFCQDFFDGTRAPLFNVIGGVNHGWRPAMTTLGFERGGTATVVYLGFELEFWDLVREMEAAGRAGDPLVRQQLAWAYTQISLMRFHGLRLVARMLAGGESGPEASIVKAFRTEYHRRFGEIALNLTGAAGMIRPTGPGYALGRWQEVFLSSRAGTIYSGTSEIQRNIMAERVLGLPRDTQAAAIASAGPGR
jgi:alkylation response protein AidB-like acyl-CoA dehydrogenase